MRIFRAGQYARLYLLFLLNINLMMLLLYMQLSTILVTLPLASVIGVEPTAFRLGGEPKCPTYMQNAPFYSFLCVLCSIFHPFSFFCLFFCLLMYFNRQTLRHLFGKQRDTKFLKSCRFVSIAPGTGRPLIDAATGTSP